MAASYAAGSLTHQKLPHEYKYEYKPIPNYVSKHLWSTSGI